MRGTAFWGIQGLGFLGVRDGGRSGEGQRAATVAKAREMAEAMRRKGDGASADTWRRVIVAIGTLHRQPALGPLAMCLLGAGPPSELF